MLAQEFFVDITTGAVRAAVSTTGKPGLVGFLGTTLNFSVGFMATGTVAPLAPYSSIKLTVKGDFEDRRFTVDPDGTPALLIETATESGATTTTRYAFSTLCDSVQLRALLDAGPYNSLILKGQIEWQIIGEDDPRKSDLFDIAVTTAYSRSTDVVPDLTLAESEAWLAARAILFTGAQALTDAQRYQGLSNAGITFTTDNMRIVKADGSVFYVPLMSGEPPS